LRGYFFNASIRASASHAREPRETVPIDIAIERDLPEHRTVASVARFRDCRNTNQDCIRYLAAPARGGAPPPQLSQVPPAAT
jgi:hypothetical protein